MIAGLSAQLLHAIGTSNSRLETVVCVANKSDDLEQAENVDCGRPLCGYGASRLPGGDHCPQ